MPDYDFLNLSSIDFEDLSRDLLQKELQLTLESFTAGRDSGIDLRYAEVVGNGVIVQCKRYTDFNLLKSNLKKEVEKLHRLKPQRYILSTNVGLTPKRKDVIVKMFAPYVQSTRDIYGKDDLNNLLGLYPEIEKQHFKLWLSSTNVLERILNRRVFNQSSFEKEQIEETIKVYVNNRSFAEALQILKDKKYVIISGIPGIGKTTLARVLVCQFLANEFEEFVYLTDSIKDGYEKFSEGKKQVFFFDDFLGSNFLESNLVKNEEKSIVNFIRKVSRSKYKLLILTTREYILKQAKLKYDIFNDNSLDFAKCVIDISQYTKIMKAKILYNHLYFSNTKKDHINYILDSGIYKEIINHKNYSPRIIQIITNFDHSQSKSVEEFEEKTMRFLEYPESLWKHVYENQISNLSKCVLVNLMSAGTPILLDDLRVLVQKFVETYSRKYGISCSEIDFKKSISELESTFIITQKDDVNQIAVSYHNPSVLDFLVNYFREQSDYVDDVLKCAIYFDQLFGVFSIEEKHIDPRLGIAFKVGNKIILNEKQTNSLIKKLLDDYTNLNSSNLSSRNFTSKRVSGWKWIRREYSEYYKLKKISDELPLEKHKDVRKFVSQKFGEYIIPTELSGDDFAYYETLFSIFKKEHIYDGHEILRKYFDCIEYLAQVSDFETFGTKFPNEYEVFMNSDENYLDKICSLVDDAIVYGSDDELDETLEMIEEVSNVFKIDFDNEMNVVHQKIAEKNVEKDSEDWNRDEWGGFTSSEKNNNRADEKIIENMFETLREK